MKEPEKIDRCILICLTVKERWTDAGGDQHENWDCQLESVEKISADVLQASKDPTQHVVAKSNQAVENLQMFLEHERDHGDNKLRRLYT